MTTIAIANQKGGVGKTTTALHLGAALARRGHAVILVDLDAQCNLTTALGVVPGRTIYDMLFRDAAANDVLAASPREELTVISGDLRMAEAEGMLYLEQNSLRLWQALAPINDRIVILDCPPTLGHLVTNALAASTIVLIPIAGHSWSVAGLRRIVEQCDAITGHLGLTLHLRALRTLVDRTRLSRHVADELAALDVPVCRTAIRRSQALADASVAGQTIFEYLPTSSGAIDYAALAEELEGEIFNDEPR